MTLTAEDRRIEQCGRPRLPYARPMATVFGRDLVGWLSLDADERGLLVLERLRGRGDQLVEWNFMLEAKREAEQSGATADEADEGGMRVCGAFSMRSCL